MLPYRTDFINQPPAWFSEAALTRNHTTNGELRKVPYLTCCAFRTSGTDAPWRLLQHFQDRIPIARGDLPAERFFKNAHYIR